MRARRGSSRYLKVKDPLVKETERRFVITLIHGDARVADAFFACVAQNLCVPRRMSRLKPFCDGGGDRHLPLLAAFAIDEREITEAPRQIIFDIVDMQDERLEAREAEDIDGAFKAALVMEIADEHGEPAPRFAGDEAPSARS